MKVIENSKGSSEAISRIIARDIDHKYTPVLEMYGITKKQIAEIACLVEKETGLPVSKDAKTGDLKITSVKNPSISVDIQEYGFRDILKQLGCDEKTGLQINGKAFDYASLWSKYRDWLLENVHEGISFYLKDLDAIYFINENFEKTICNTLEVYEAGLPPGKMNKQNERELLESWRKKLALHLIAHETTHKTIYENNPEFKREESRLSAERFRLMLTMESVEGKEKEEAIKKHSEVTKNLVAILACDETIAYLTEWKVTTSLGLGGQLLPDPETKLRIQAGIGFFSEVEKLTGSNPIPTVVKNIPSFEDMREPAKYVERLKLLKGA